VPPLVSKSLACAFVRCSTIRVAAHDATFARLSFLFVEIGLVCINDDVTVDLLLLLPLSRLIYFLHNVQGHNGGLSVRSYVITRVLYSRHPIASGKQWGPPLLGMWFLLFCVVKTKNLPAISIGLSRRLL
jgi:hypothetical protein